MYVLRSTQFDQKVAEFGLDAKIASFVEKLQAAATPADVSKLMSPIHPFLKRRFTKYRVLSRIWETSDQSTHVVALLDVMQRKSRAYREFMQNRTEASTQRQVEQEVTQLHIDKWVREQPRAADEAPRLPAHLTEWLEPLTVLAAGAADESYDILETDGWVKSVRSDFINTPRGLGVVHKVICDLVEQGGSPGDVQVKSGEGCYVVFQNRTATEILLLHASSEPPSPEQLDAFRSLARDGLVERRVRKTYRSLVVYDWELWAAIQAEEEANLNLSTDERDLLRSIGSLSNQSPFPAVISGRAGSGKTTMLTHIFTALLTRKLRSDGLDGRPVYVTYSPRLLRRARTLVFGLLRAHDRYSVRLHGGVVGSGSFDDLEAALDGHFFTFHDLLREHLPENVRGDFPPHRHVGFAEVKRAMAHQPARLPMFPSRTFGFTPEVAWYAIRQFVKGLSDLTDEEAEWEDIEESFELLHRADKHGMDVDLLKKIYDDVYCDWYRPAMRDRGLWDDQDLVTAVLKEQQGGFRPSIGITAIVCDEVQDFTTREIRFLVRANNLLDYKIPAYQALRLPIVLAGDSLQTLAPTGFRWQSLTAVLHEEVFSATGRKPDTKTPLLSQNYRSTKSIVQFCNLLQYKRRQLFPHVANEIRPQSPWQQDQTAAPTYFDTGSDGNITESEVIALLGDPINTVIVPCEADGEIDYIKGDRFLSAAFPDATKDRPPSNVLSASAAKGAEYASIFLYNFGVEYAAAKFDRNREVDLAKEFFFNKLYVAASRARTSLRVVEARPAPDSEPMQLWQDFLRDPISSMLSQAADDPVFEAMIMGLDFGLPGAWRAADSDREPLSELAERELARGRQDEDSRACRRAATAFSGAAESSVLGVRDMMLRREKEATAWALLFEGEYLTAGRQFAELGQQLGDSGLLDAAWQAFVDGGAWIQAQELNAPIATEEDRDVVRFLAAAASDVDAVVRVAESFGRRLKPDERLDRTSLRGIAQETIEERVSLMLADTQISECSRLAGALRKIVHHVRPSLRALVAELYFRIGDMGEAVHLYEAVPLTPIQRAHQAEARARQRGFPDGLDVLCNAGHHAKVVEIWREYSSPKDDSWLRRVEPSLQVERCFEELLGVALERRDMALALQHYRKLRNQESRAKSAMYAERMIELLRRDFSLYAEIPELIKDVADTMSAQQASLLSERVVLQALDMWARPRQHGREGANPFDGNLANSVGFGDQQKSALSDVLSMHTPEPSGRQLDPRWLGLAYELAEDWDAAIHHYSVYRDRTETRDIMQFAREGIVRVQRLRTRRPGARGQRSFDPESRHKDEVAAADVAARWGIDVRQAMRVSLDPELVPFHVQATAHGEIASGGEFGPFSWRPKGERIRLDYDAEVSRSWTINAKERTVRGHEGQMGRSRDGAFRTEVAGWAIEIRVNSQETVIDLVPKAGNEVTGRHRARLPHGLR
jgi:hypothetical protein